MIKRNVILNENVRVYKKKTDKETQTPKGPHKIWLLLKKLKQSMLIKSNLFFFFLGLLSSNFIYTIFSNDPDRSDLRFLNNDHKLAVVVPYRDRFEELLMFVPHISNFLHSKSIDFKIYIINQVDELRFNRASLINVGFLYSMKECDYMVMHDVDLLPLNKNLDYSYPEIGPFHISSPGLHPEYNYSTFIGGILMISRDHFLKTNGMSNRYWGWGREDDDFYNRLKKANLTVVRPNLKDFQTGNKYTFFNNHDSNKRKRDKKRFLKQKKESLKFDQTGLDSTQYRIQSINEIFINKYPCTIINVELFCDRYDTHWCTMDYQFL